MLSKFQQLSHLVDSPQLLTGWSPSESCSHSYTEHGAWFTVGAQCLSSGQRDGRMCVGEV